jgi:probable phosphoglycerate mutase
MTKPRTDVLLVRHGETPWNTSGRWQGHGDPGLTDFGRTQALELARILAAEAIRPWTHVIASDLERARETAFVLAESLGLPFEFDTRLRELDVGEWSGLSREEIEKREPEALHAFEQGEPTLRPGGGESRIEIRERTHAFMRDVAERFSGGSIIVVTHLGVIRALVPGAEPTNAERIAVVAEEIAARPIDRHRRREDGAL